MQLYRGDWLDGLNIPDAPNFEDWLDTERTALRESAARAASTLADRSDSEGDLAAAIRWSRRALELTPFDENTARRLIILLDRTGDRAGAVATFEGFSSKLHRELDIDPAPETISIVDAIRQRTGDGRPSTEIGLDDEPPDLEIRLSSGDGKPAAAIATSTVPVRSPSPGSSRRLSHQTLAIGATAAIIALGSLAYLQLRPDGSSPKAVQPIMVVPFENRTEESALDPLAEMAADWVTHGIAATGIFEVVPSTAVLSTRRHRDASLDQAAALRWLVRETRARSVVTGAFYLSGDSIIFHTQLTRARDGRVLTTIEPVRVPADDPQSGIDGVRRDVLAALAPLAEIPTHASVATRPPSFEAYRAYVSGMEAFIRFDFETALRHFDRALQSDDTYAMPWLASAIARSNLGRSAEADSIAQRLDRRRTELGPLEVITLDFLQALLRGDDEAAYEAMLRHRKLAPGTIGHYQLAEQARRLNRPREAISVLRELGPERGELRGWIPYWRELATSRHMLGQHRRELAVARRARALYPDSPITISQEIRALAALGRTGSINEVIRERKGARNGEGQVGSLKMLAATYLHHHGHTEAASDFAERALTWFKLRNEGGAFERSIAWTHFFNGDHEAALAIYERLADEQPSNVQIMGQLGVTLAALGRVEEALKVEIDPAVMDMPYHRWQTSYYRAAIYAYLGDSRAAVGHLQAAFGTGMVHGPWVAADPNLRPLHRESQFQDLLRPRG